MSIFFQDSENHKLNLNSMWLYPGIFMTCLSKHQRKKLMSPPSWNGARKLQGKPSWAHCPRSSLIWCKESHVFDQTWAPFTFPTLTSQTWVYFSVAPSWLKLLGGECFPSAFYGSYKSVWTVPKVWIFFFLTIFWSRMLSNETAQDNRIMSYFPYWLPKVPFIGTIPWG